MTDNNPYDIVYARCLICGYSTNDPSELEMWNGYSDHSGQTWTTKCQDHSVWVLRDGTVTVINGGEHVTVEPTLAQQAAAEPTLAEQVAALQPGKLDIEVTITSKRLNAYHGSQWLTLDNGLTIRHANGDLLPGITAVRVITPAEPPCPFEIGATVYHVKGKGEPRKVTEWDGIYVHFRGNPLGGSCLPEYLSLTMPEPPIGSLVEDKSGIPGYRHRNGKWYFAGSTASWAWNGARGLMTVVRWGGAK